MLLLKKLWPLKHNWKNVFKALVIIFNNPNDTKQFFIIMRTLNNPAYMKAYLRFNDNEIAKTKPELADILSDENLLDTMPPDSVGAKYKQFIKRYKFSARDLEKTSQLVMPEISNFETIHWLQRRDRDAHDILHILTGYDRSAFGEICVQNFAYGQLKATGQMLFVLTAFIKLIKDRLFYRIPAFFEAYDRGKHASLLFTEDYYKLLFEPLAEARIRLNIKPAIKYNKTIRNLRAMRDIKLYVKTHRNKKRQTL